MKQIKRKENYEWLIGYEMGGLVYNGTYWCIDDKTNKKFANNQYEFIKYDSDNRICEVILMDYQDFKQYINKYELPKKLKNGGTN